MSTEEKGMSDIGLPRHQDFPHVWADVSAHNAQMRFTSDLTGTDTRFYVRREVRAKMNSGGESVGSRVCRTHEIIARES